MPPDKPSRRVDMIDFDEIKAKVARGEKVSLCRCYRSKRFPYCDGSHLKHNEETGDNIAPAVMTSGLDQSKRGLTFKTEVRVPPTLGSSHPTPLYRGFSLADADRSV
jgi:CDGSH-type Zn-finger protein